MKDNIIEFPKPITSPFEEWLESVNKSMHSIAEALNAMNESDEIMAYKIMELANRISKLEQKIIGADE